MYQFQNYSDLIKHIDQYVHYNPPITVDEELRAMATTIDLN